MAPVTHAGHEALDGVTEPSATELAAAQPGQQITLTIARATDA